MSINQWAHSGWGGFIACAVDRFVDPLYGLLAVLVWAVGKELYDVLHDKQPWLGALQDVGWYAAGGLVATAIEEGARRL